MSLIEKPPTLGEIAQSTPLGGLACGILVALDILTLEAPAKGPADFSSMSAYQDYIKQRRFYRGFQKSVGQFGHTMLNIVGKNLQEKDHATWGVFALRTDTSLGLDGRFDPDAIDASYFIGLHLWQKPLKPGQDPSESILIDGLQGVYFPPVLTQQDKYPGVSKETRIINQGSLHDEQGEITPYQLDMVHEVTIELEQQAMALRYLNQETA